MIGRFVRFVLVVFLILGAAAYFTGYWQPEWLPPAPTVAGSRPIDTSNARERAEAAGRELGAQAKKAAKELDEVVSDGTLTTKIKSKMALDDLVNARTINVDTKDRVVTLTGTVGSARERERAVQLARETNGVTRVEDRLTQP
jgi:osmotically-inducible protein OsmY